MTKRRSAASRPKPDIAIGQFEYSRPSVDDSWPQTDSVGKELDALPAPERDARIDQDIKSVLRDWHAPDFEWALEFQPFRRWDGYEGGFPFFNLFRLLDYPPRLEVKVRERLIQLCQDGELIKYQVRDETFYRVLPP